MADELLDATCTGDATRLAALLDEQPDCLHVRTPPYEWTLLHHAAHHGRLAVVDLLLSRGLEVNARESGDNTYAMHWAAAAGHLDVVRRLADAGGDVVGHGDDHDLEVIGWATCWGNYHADVAGFLVERGARHHIFSAIALDLGDEVRRILGDHPAQINRRLTRNDAERLPLHHAVLNGRPAMAALLMEHGADPLAVDGEGFTAMACAWSPRVDAPVMEAIRSRTLDELDSARRGHRAARLGQDDLMAALALEDLDLAERLLGRGVAVGAGGTAGALHLMAKRNDLTAARWLLARGADPKTRWGHWDAAVTPLHLAAAQGHTEMVRLLLEAGADRDARDSKHDGTAAGWAQHGRVPQAPNWREIVAIIEQGEWQV